MRSWVNKAPAGHRASGRGTMEVGKIDRRRTYEQTHFGRRCVRASRDRKKGNFVTVELTFINNGDEAVTLDSESLAIIDDQNRTFETDTDASFYVPTNRDLFLNQVNPGVTFQGTTIFSIAPDAEGLILQAGDTEMFTDENAYIDLGI